MRDAEGSHLPDEKWVGTRGRGAAWMGGAASSRRNVATAATGKCSGAMRAMQNTHGRYCDTQWRPMWLII